MENLTLQEIASKPGSTGELNQSLNALSQRAIQTSVKETDQVMELALGFQAWTELALPLGADWCENHCLQAHDFILQLKNQAPAPQVMEKLLRLILQTHRLLEKENIRPAAGKEKETDAPPTSRRTAPKAEPFRKKKPATLAPEAREWGMNVRPEDLGFFQIFLLDVPSRLEDAQSKLAEIPPENKSDVSPLYRILHVIRGQFGFLGFLEAWRLGREMERLLDPLMGGQQPMTQDVKDGISQALSFLQAQAEQVEGGLPDRMLQVLDAGGLLEKLKHIPVTLASKGQADRFHLEPETDSPPPWAGLANRARARQLDGLFENLVELVLAQNRILEDYRPLAKPQGLAEAARLQKATMHLRDGFLSMEMTPVEPLLAEAVQMAGALARQKNLAIGIAVEGAGVELDQRLLPELREPLSHLIQNALEHGLERTHDRRARGKNPEGRLKLKASHKDGAFLLEVEDDGCGLDPNKIKQRAVELGWLGKEEEPPSRLLEFIFKPGFSMKAPGSAEAGTGLDTVRRKMESLLGSVRVQSQTGRGCKFTLKMPRSLALMDGWVVQAAGKKYLLPVAQTLKIEPVDKVASPKGGEVIPVVSLARALGAASGGPAGKLAVLVEAGFQQVRLRVDEVPGKQQVLVKNNKEGFTAPPGLRAEALLPDGTTGWILDIASLLREENEENPRKE